MALTTVKKYLFENGQKEANSFFELTSLRVDTYCIASRDEVSNHYKVFWIEDGDGTYLVDTNEFSVKGSGVFFLSPGQVFCVKNEKVKSAYQIEFDGDFYCIESHGKEIACNGLLFNNVHRSSVISVKPEEKEIFQSLINQMIAELENKGRSHKELLVSYLRMYLIHALRLLEKEEVESQKETHKGNQQVQEFIALVDQQFKKVHTVKGYAEQLFISPKSLAKKLQALGYPTPLQVIQNRIILEAKRQLKFSNLSIKEIAFELGFEDPAYFSRLFSKNSEVSPAAYRKAN